MSQRESEPPIQPHQPEEGVDYIIDLYQLIGIQQNADTEAINEAFKNAKAMYAPDQYRRAPEHFIQEAERKMRIITNAERILKDPAQRAIYDQKLASWENPRTISTTGDPIIDLSYPSSLRLLSQPAKINEAIQHILQQAHQMSGFDPIIFQFIEQQYTTTEQPSETLINAYKKALAQKDVELELEESSRRDIIGLDSNIVTRTSPPERYLERAELDTQKRRAEITDEVDRIILSLTSPTTKLLETSESSTETLSSDEANRALSIYKQQVLENYEAQAERIRQLAEERELLMAKRLTLVKANYYPDQPQLFNRVIIKLINGTTEHWFAYYIDGSAIVNDTSITQSELLALDDPNNAQAMIARGYNIAELSHQEGLPLESELREVMTTHFTNYLDSQEESNQQSSQ